MIDAGTAIGSGFQTLLSSSGAPLPAWPLAWPLVWPLAWIDGWLNPGLLAAAGLAVVPLVIHLLNRQRHRPMPWAAMRFVLAAYRKVRRRARLEELLLLLLRIAGVLLLALAIARPFAGSQSPLAALTENRRDLVLAIDGSASTGFRETVQSTFEIELERARAILTDLDRGRGDRVRLVLAGATPRLLSWRTPEEALSVLATLTQPTDEPLDLAALFVEIVRYAEEDAAGTNQSALEVRVLTDLQRTSFDPTFEIAQAAAAPLGPPSASPGGTDEAGDETPTFFEPLDRLAELGVTVLLEDHGPAAATPENLGLESIEPLTPPLGPGAPFEVAVTVANRGSKARSGVRVALSENGQRRPVETVEVPARSTGRVVFTVSSAKSGPHTLEAELEGDRLVVDDRRARVVRVPPPVRVLLVDGAPARRIEEDETGFLAAILEPPTDDDVGLRAASRPFTVRIVPPDELRDEQLVLDDFDAIVLANVESLPTTAVARLEARVAAGGALIFGAGDRVDAQRWNELAWRADQSGLLPAELGAVMEVRERRAGYWRVRDFDAGHPALSFFADERWRPLLSEAPIYAFLSVHPEPNARVLATLDDEAGRPLLVEKPYDRGRVVLWTTSFDSAWTLIPSFPQTFVPLMHELLRYAARPAEPSANLGVSEPLIAELDVFPRSPVLLRPDGARRPIDGEPTALGSRRWRLPAYAGTDRVGLYRLEVEGEPSRPYAVHFDAREGDLERIPAGEVAALHPALAVATATPDGDVEDEAPVQGELWRGLALAALLALVGESLWAAFLGYKRNRVA